MTSEAKLGVCAITGTTIVADVPAVVWPRTAEDSSRKTPETRSRPRCVMIASLCESYRGDDSTPDPEGCQRGAMELDFSIHNPRSPRCP